ncbi:MAG TPA: hypothetical protein VKE69_11300 [Planctomycetota bacterium]|nr:hypothetical protein [Planctomycetota bacterium]
MSDDRRIAAWLFALFAFGYSFVGGWAPEDPDTEVAFQATRAIAAHGRLHLEPDTPSTRAILSHLGPDGGAHNCRPGRDGRQYPYWGLAYVASGLPPYFAGQALAAAFPSIEDEFGKQRFTASGIEGSDYFARAAVLALSPIFAAATLALVYLAARRIGVSPAASCVAAVVLGTTSFGVQARSGLSDVQGTFWVALALERAFAALERPRAALGFGAACGIALLTLLRAPMAAAPLAVLVAGCAARRGGAREAARTIGWMALGAAPFVAACLLANFVRWGDPLITGFEKSTATATFWLPWRHRIVALARLLFSPGKGVAFYALGLLVLGVAGTALLARRRGWIAAALASCVAFAWYVPASTIEWHGAWSFGPRYALPGFPALAVASAVAVDAARGAWRAVALAPAVAGFVLVLPGFVTSPYAAIAIAMERARVEWPDSSFGEQYVAAEDRDTERFQRICIAAGEMNPLRIQHEILVSTLRGRPLAPENRAPELHGFASVGWWGFAERFDSGAVLVVPALLAFGALASVLRLRRALA